VEKPSTTSRFVVTLSIIAVTAAYLIVCALSQHRRLAPTLQDEYSYLIQAHQLAAGHLWMPKHPLADFFDSFQLIVDPVYASVYFPGNALLLAAALRLHAE